MEFLFRCVMGWILLSFAAFSGVVDAPRFYAPLWGAGLGIGWGAALALKVKDTELKIGTAIFIAYWAVLAGTWIHEGLSLP